MRYLSIAVLLNAAACGQGTDPLPTDVPHCAMSSTVDTTIAVPTGSDPLGIGDTRTHSILTAMARVPAGNVTVSGHCTLEMDYPLYSLPGPGAYPVLVVSANADDYHWAPPSSPDDHQALADVWLCRWDFADPAWYARPNSFTDEVRQYYAARAHASVCYIAK